MSLTNSFLSIIIGVATESWSLFEEAAPYLFLGFAVAGILHVLVPDEKILKYLGKSAGKVKSALNASLLGIPLPLCSCGVVPTALSLKNRGATKGATLSFLISTPETGVDSIAITYALLDPIMTVFRPIASMTTALLTGITENILGSEESKKESFTSKKNVLMMQQPIETCSDSSCGCHSDSSLDEDSSMFRKLAEAFRYSFVELLGDIAGWLIFGIIIAGVISYLIPDELIGDYLGGGIFSMLIVLVIGIPLYICATASTPLAAALVSKGMSPGTAFVFLLAGPATNAATITMVAKFLGKRSATIYLSMIALCSLAFGLLLDFIYLRMGIEVSSIVGSASEVLAPEVKTAFALLLIPFMMYGVYKQQKFKKTDS